MNIFYYQYYIMHFSLRGSPCQAFAILAEGHLLPHSDVVLNESVVSKSFRKSFQKLSRKSNTKNYKCFGEKKGSWTDFYWSYEA